MALRVVVQPAVQSLISLAEAKDQCRVDFADDDAAITRLTLAATETVEAYVQRKYMAQTLEWVCERWPVDQPFPVAGVNGFDGMVLNSVTYADLTGAQQTLDPNQYWGKAAGQTLRFVPRWYIILPWLGDALERVVLNFSVPGDETTVPASAKHACALLVSHWYENPDAVVGVENRDSSAEMPQSVERLLWGERWER